MKKSENNFVKKWLKKSKKIKKKCYKKTKETLMLWKIMEKNCKKMMKK